MPERGKQANVDVTVTSNLVGTAIDLPAPFGKDRDATRKLSINVGNAVKPVKTLHLASATYSMSWLTFRSGLAETQRIWLSFIASMGKGNREQ